MSSLANILNMSWCLPKHTPLLMASAGQAHMSDPQQGRTLAGHSQYCCPKMQSFSQVREPEHMGARHTVLNLWWLRQWHIAAHVCYACSMQARRKCHTDLSQEDTGLRRCRWTSPLIGRVLLHLLTPSLSLSPAALKLLPGQAEVNFEFSNDFRQ